MTLWTTCERQRTTLGTTCCTASAVGDRMDRRYEAGVTAGVRQPGVRPVSRLATTSTVTLGVDVGVELDRDDVGAHRLDGLGQLDLAPVDPAPVWASMASARSAAVTDPNSRPSARPGPRR